MILSQCSKWEGRELAASKDRLSAAEKRIRDELVRSPYAEIRRVRCRFSDEVVVLEGRVSSFFLKQVAQTVVASLVEAREVANHLEVLYPED